LGDSERIGRARGRESRPVLEKVVGAIVFGVIFLGTLVWGALPFTFGVALAAVIGSVELFSMFETKGEATPTAAVVGIAASIAYVFLAHYRPIESIGYVTVGLIFLSFMWYMLVLRHVKPTKAVALTIFAPLLTGFCLSYLVMLRDFAGRTNPDKNNGWWFILFLIALIWIYDIFAWMVGRKIGRHKMSPTVSPNKSWEGTIAGTLGTLVGSIALWAIIRALMGHLKYDWFSIWVALITAAIVCVFGPLGDLAESLMKRDYAVKDMGSLIPGHGGIMDRFDSTFFTAPVVFFYLYYFVFKL
jgi:phosphatidate cytidylyltransferase